jgi:ubiquinone/menaquinone biosynthesis C-methylase UbiE
MIEAVIFSLLWVGTFFPAWHVLLKLIALSTSDKKLKPSFFLWFASYQFIMALPYLYLLIFNADSLNGVVKSVIVGMIALGFALSILRFFFAGYVNLVLWYVYGQVYDGLMHFYPYVSLQKLVDEHMSPQKEMTVLDLGCGSGNQTVLLANDASVVVAVDNSKSMLARLRKKIRGNHEKKVTVIESDLLEYLKSEQSSKFDAISMVNVLYTVTDRALLWRELLRVLKPEGKIVVTNSDKGGSLSIIKEHIKHRGVISLLRPSLVAVFVIDSLISEMAKTGHFNFIAQDKIEAEVKHAGGEFRYITRCYGDVNILFTVTK